MSINTISKKNRQHNGQKKKKIVRGLIWRNNILAVYNRQGFSNIRILVSLFPFLSFHERWGIGYFSLYWIQI
jgi:hypothetical protein